MRSKACPSLLCAVPGLGAGAEAGAKSVNPKHLEPVPTRDAYVLADSYSCSEKAATFTLAPGRYVAAFFVIRGKLPHQPEMGPIINWIIAYGEGSFLFPTSTQDDALLRSKLERVPADAPPAAVQADDGTAPVATGAGDR
jgi:hypothetical protein